MQFTVSIEVQVTADSVEEAAKFALNDLRDPGLGPWHADVSCSRGKKRNVLIEGEAENEEQVDHHAAKVNLADDELAGYDFGDDVTVEGQDSWDTSDPSDFTKVVYVRYSDMPPEADTEKVSFHVKFDAINRVAEAYALEMRHGNEIGQRGGVTVVVDLDSGAIHNVRANAPVRVIFLDADTEGGDEENIHTVDGEEVYVSDYQIEKGDESLSVDQVAAVVAQL